MAFEILIKKLQVEDTGAYQEMIRMNYKTFCEILMATLVILPFAILVWALFRQNCWQKKSFTIIHMFKQQKTIINYHVEFEHVQTTQ